MSEFAVIVNGTIPSGETVRIFVNDDPDQDGTAEYVGEADFLNGDTGTEKTVSTGSSSYGDVWPTVVFNPQGGGSLTSTATVNSVELSKAAIKISYYDGSSFVNKPLQYYDGTTFTDPASLKYYNGTKWTNVG